MKLTQFKKKTRTLMLGAVVLCSLFAAPVTAQDKLYTNEFPLKDVVLLDGPFKHARDLNIKVLLEYDVDRLINVKDTVSF